MLRVNWWRSRNADLPVGLSIRFCLARVRVRFRICDADSFAKEIFLWQEVAHQRFSIGGNSHIFVHCFVQLHARNGSSISTSGT